MNQPASTIFRCPFCWQIWDENHDCTGAASRKEELLRITDDTNTDRMITDSAWYLP